MDLVLIFSAFFRALGQTGDPRFRRVLGVGIALTLAVLVAATALVLGLIDWAIGPQTTLPFLGTVGWLDNVAELSGFFAMMVLSVFLMIPIASAMTGMFLDQVAHAVEDRHFPTLPPADELPLGQAILDSLGFFGVIVVANAIALLFYIFLAPLAPFIFWGINGYLLGREYFTLAALRRMSRAEAQALRRRHGLTIWAGGVLMAIPLSIPILNLVVPILGAATFTHIYHGLARKGTRGHPA